MKDKLYKILILMPFLWSFSGLLIFRNGDKLMVVTIIISIIVTLLNYGVDSIKKNINDKGLWLVLAITAYTVFSYHYHGSSSREIRALLAATLLLLTFPRDLMTTNVLKWLIFIGSFIILGSTYYFNEYLHLPRVLWPINAIPHATMGASIVALALVLLIHAKNTRDKIILSSSFMMAISAVVINETRGVWLALIIAIIMILCLNMKIKHINWRYSLFTVVIVVIGLYVAKPQIEQRIEQTGAEITQIQAGDLNTSIGLRLQMWALAPKLIEENPILGSGNGHKDIFNKLAQQGYISAGLIQFNPAHYHNQYLDRLIKSGAVGLILLLVILIYPVIFSLPGFNQQVAIGIVAVYGIGSLTDVPFNHGVTIFMYLLLIFTLKTKHHKVNS